MRASNVGSPKPLLSSTARSLAAIPRCESVKDVISKSTQRAHLFFREAGLCCSIHFGLIGLGRLDDLSEGIVRIADAF